MRIVNKLTKPGDIRRVDLTPDTVRVQTSDGQERLYKLCSEPMPRRVSRDRDNAQSLEAQENTETSNETC